MEALHISIGIWFLASLTWPIFMVGSLIEIQRYKNRFNVLKTKHPLMYRVMEKEGR